MLTPEQVTDIEQENVWCREDKQLILATIRTLQQQNKQLVEVLEEIATKPIALKVDVLQEIARKALGKE